MRDRLLTGLGLRRGAVVAFGLLVAVSLAPAQLHGQGVARDALASFPADTQQFAYLNLAQFRSMAEFPQIHRYLLNSQLRDFQDFLRSAGVDPMKDVDEVVLGWRGEAGGGAGFYGRAEGRFDLDRVRKIFTQQALPRREYQAQELYAFGSGESPTDMFFAFLSPTAAAFGRLRDLKDILDVRARAKPALDTNSKFVDWEAELEGTSPQWGIATGKAAVNQVVPWIAAGRKLNADPGTILGPVQAFLYRIDWSGGMSANLSIVCQNAESAKALATLLTLWRDSRPAEATPTSLGLMIQSVQVYAEGARVELTASGSIETFSQILRGPTSGGQ
ncbi:MAG: hypothetical protein LAN62_12525 [Acidobacteriia bacterium]|nr:hypothetical protein [Terriglobia bacterium]